MKKFYVAGLVAIILSVGFWSYVKAVDNQEITACVKNSGLIYVVGDIFKITDCKNNDTLLTWNTAGQDGLVGPQGERGDQGIQGLQGEIGLQGLTGPQGIQGASAQQGSGNIAFYYNDRFLTTNGIVYSYNSGTGGPWNTIDNMPGINPPMPVSEIAVWNFTSLIDINGDVWRYKDTDAGFTNIGQPPL